MAKCPYTHLNGFEHLDVDLDGAEQGFDLGYKFERRDARTPFWVLYVSYDAAGLGLGLVARGTLTFADSLAGAGRSSEWSKRRYSRGPSPPSPTLSELSRQVSSFKRAATIRSTYEVRGSGQGRLSWPPCGGGPARARHR